MSSDASSATGLASTCFAAFTELRYASAVNRRVREQTRGDRSGLGRTPEEGDDADGDEAQVRRHDREVDDLRGDEDAPAAGPARQHRAYTAEDRERRTSCG